MNILFLVAHPDDEAYGPYGTIAKLAKSNNVTVVSMCNGARPGYENVSDNRISAFRQNCIDAGVEWKIYDSPDLSLEPRSTLKTVETLISHIGPDIVYTHNNSDLNNDHRVLSEAALVACRPKPDSTVHALYFFEVLSSTSWTFGQLEPAFVPTVFVDISDYVDAKKTALGRYTTETYDFPDMRSIAGTVDVLAKYRGSQVGYNYAEAFKLVFSKQ